ncbi:MAG: hypothetical protein ACOH2K_14970 [Burkholderiaceae bacterium]
MKHSEQQLNDFWQAIKKPENAKKSVEAENSLIPALQIHCEDDVAQIMSLPNEDGTARDIYVRRPGDKWAELP